MTGICPAIAIWPNIARAAARCETSLVENSASQVFAFGKLRDQVGAAEGRDDDGLSRGEHLIYECALVVREADVAFAVGDAHEKRGDGHVVAVGRRQLQRADVGELRVGAQRLQRIHAPANFGSSVSPG